MATKREGRTKDGRRYYEFRARTGRGQTEHTKRWYFPEGWSRVRIDRAADKAMMEFDEEVRRGAHLTKQQEKEKAAVIAAEAAKVKTFDRYIEDVYFPNAQLSENARSSYETQLRLHISPYIGSKKTNEITADDIEKVLSVRRSSGCAYESVLKVYTVLRSVFKCLYKKNPRNNPMLEVERPQKNLRHETAIDDATEVLESDDVEAYSLEEIIALQKLIQEQPLKWRLYITILIETGIRRGECTALKWSCIDFDSGDIRIEESVGYTKSKGVYKCPPKNNKARTVTVTSNTLKMLKNWRTSQEGKGISSEYVFTQRDSPDIMFPTAPTKHLKTLGDKLGIENLHPHKLRHSFASVTITNGADIVSVSELLGHSDKSVTLKIYAHANAKSKRQVSEQFFTLLEENGAEK